MYKEKTNTMDWNNIIIGILGIFTGAGFWGVVKSALEKKKTPYDLFIQMVEEERKFYQMKNKEYEQKDIDSAEKSAVIAQSSNCFHRFKDPEIICPVEKANEMRLRKKCLHCELQPEPKPTE